LRETGTHLHPVGVGTITLPPGWAERLVPFGVEDGLKNVWALEIHDLASSKLIVGRDKDYDFIVELLRRGLIELQTLLARFVALRDTPYAGAIRDRLAHLAQHLDRARLHAEASAVRRILASDPSHP